MIRSKILHSISPKDLLFEGKQVELIVSGHFNTLIQMWKYYACSVVSDKNNSSFIMTTDLHSYKVNFAVENVDTYAKEFKNIDDAKKFNSNFMDKWETGSNEPKQEVRDSKIKDILYETQI